MHLNEASEYDGFGRQQAPISTKISPDDKPCGSREGMRVYVHVLRFTQILAFWPRHWNFHQLDCGFLLVWR